MRVLITGMGGELGTRVATSLEGDPSVDAIVGLDVEPPRRHLARAVFHRIDPRSRARVEELVDDLQPTHVVHLGAFEPNARSGPRRAGALTAGGTVALFESLERSSAVEHVVVRSGIEVYGRRRGAPMRPDESSPTDPTSPFGHSLRHVEQVALDVGRRLDVPVARLRFGPIVGPHFPSPLGRLLRLPLVPYAALSDPPFAVCQHQHAAAAVVAAVSRRADGACNVLAPGAVTASQAARLGGRLPLPVAGPGWRGARLAAEFAATPMPEHVRELLRRGRGADGTEAVHRLGISPSVGTRSVVAELYDWPEFTHVPRAEALS